MIKTIVHTKPRRSGKRAAARFGAPKNSIGCTSYEKLGTAEDQNLQSWSRIEFNRRMHHIQTTKAESSNKVNIFKCCFTSLDEDDVAAKPSGINSAIPEAKSSNTRSKKKQASLSIYLPSVQKIRDGESRVSWCKVRKNTSGSTTGISMSPSTSVQGFHGLLSTR